VSESGSAEYLVMWIAWQRERTPQGARSPVHTPLACSDPAWVFSNPRRPAYA